MPRSPERARAATRVAIRTRHYGPDDPRTVDARRELAEAAISDTITQQVTSAPPLTSEQRARLAALLWSATPNGDGR